MSPPLKPQVLQLLKYRYCRKQSLYSAVLHYGLFRRTSKVNLIIISKGLKRNDSRTWSNSCEDITGPVNNCAFDFLQTQILEYFYVHKHKGVACSGFETQARSQWLLDGRKKLFSLWRKNAVLRVYLSWEWGEVNL